MINKIRKKNNKKESNNTEFNNKSANNSPLKLNIKEKENKAKFKDKKKENEEILNYLNCYDEFEEDKIIELLTELNIDDNLNDKSNVGKFNKDENKN